MISNKKNTTNWFSLTNDSIIFIDFNIERKANRINSPYVMAKGL